MLLLSRFIWKIVHQDGKQNIFFCFSQMILLEYTRNNIEKLLCKFFSTAISIFSSSTSVNSNDFSSKSLVMGNSFIHFLSILSLLHERIFINERLNCLSHFLTLITRELINHENELHTKRNSR